MSSCNIIPIAKPIQLPSSAPTSEEDVAFIAGHAKLHSRAHMQPSNSVSFDVPTDYCQAPALSNVHSKFDIENIKKKLISSHEEDISQEEIIFLLVSFVCNASEAQSQTESLISRFGSLAAVLAASQQNLIDTAIQLDNAALFLLTVRRALVMALREPIENAPLLGKSSQLRDYLRISLAHEKSEVVRLLLLNTRNRLIKDELHSRGIVNHTPVYPREIVRRVIETNASALILVHNHPCGDPTPSEEDLRTTRQIARVLQDIGATLHDHVVVGRHSCTSLRSLGLM